MAGIFIFMFVFVLILFIVSRIVWINVVKNDEFRLELHLPIIAIHLTKSKNTKTSKRKKEKKWFTTRYKSIAKPLSNLITKSEIIIKRIEFPKKHGEISNTTFTRPIRYGSAFFALCAYLKAKAEKLTVYDDQIILSSDSSALQFNFTVKLRLYQLINATLAILFGVVKDKLKKGLANVR